MSVSDIEKKRLLLFEFGVRAAKVIRGAGSA